MEQSISEIEIIHFNDFANAYNNFLKKEKIEYFKSQIKFYQFLKGYLSIKGIDSIIFNREYLITDRGLIIHNSIWFYDREIIQKTYAYLKNSFTLKIGQKIFNKNQFSEIKEIIKVEDGFKIVFKNDEIIHNPFVIWSITN